MGNLVSIIEPGLPDSRLELPTELHEYFQFRERLYTVDGVVLYKDRVVIPPTLRARGPRPHPKSNWPTTHQMGQDKSCVRSKTI